MDADILREVFMHTEDVWYANADSPRTCEP